MCSVSDGTQSFSGWEPCHAETLSKEQKLHQVYVRRDGSPLSETTKRADLACASPKSSHRHPRSIRRAQQHKQSEKVDISPRCATPTLYRRPLHAAHLEGSSKACIVHIHGGSSKPFCCLIGPCQRGANRTHPTMRLRGISPSAILFFITPPPPLETTAARKAISTAVLGPAHASKHHEVSLPS